MATNAKYKVYNGTDWIEYHFSTNAGQVSTTSARKFLTTSVTVNGNTAGTTGAKVTVGSGDAANIEIDGAHITGKASAVSGNSLQYITANDSIAAALGKLDKAAHDAAQSAVGYVPYTGADQTVDLGNAGIISATYSFSADYEQMYIEGAHRSNTSYDDITIYNGAGGIILIPDDNAYIGSVSNDNIIATHKWVEDKGYALSSSLGTAATKNFTTNVTQNSGDLITSGAVYTALSNLPTPMQFKGTLGTGGTITTLPAAAAANNGYMYKVITAGTYQSVAAQVGDALISNGSSWVLIPSGDESFTDTWRAIQVNGTQLLGNTITSGVVNFKNGGHITVTGSSNNITLGVESGYSIPSTTDQTAWSNKYSKPSGGIPATDLASGVIPDVSGFVSGSSLTANQIVLGDGNKNVKISSYKPASSSTTWDGTSDVYLPTMKAIAARGYSKVTVGTSAPSSPNTNDVWIDIN